MRLQRLTGPRAREDRGRVRGSPGHHPPPPRDPRHPSSWSSRSSRGELREIKEAYGDARRTEIVAEAQRHHDRRHDRRRGHGHHRVARRLHQALAAVALPRAAPRRQGPHRHADEGRGHRRAPLRRHRRTRTSSSSPTSGRLYWLKVHAIPEVGVERARQGDREPAALSSRRERARAADRRATSTKRKYVVMATRAGKIKKTELTRVLERARHRHHRHRHQRRRRSLRRRASRDGQTTRSSSARTTAGHPLQRERTFVRWAAAPPASRASRCAKATTSSRWMCCRVGRAGAAEPPAEGEEPEIVEETEVGVEDDEVVAADERGYILTVTEKGFGKRTPVSRVPPAVARRHRRHQHQDHRQERQGRRHRVRLRRRPGPAHHRAGHDHPHERRRHPLDGPHTQGVRVINIDENDRVVAAVKLVDKDDGKTRSPTDDGEPADSETPDDDTIH